MVPVVSVVVSVVLVEVDAVEVVSLVVSPVVEVVSTGAPVLVPSPVDGPPVSVEVVGAPVGSVVLVVAVVVDAAPVEPSVAPSVVVAVVSPQATRSARLVGSALRRAMAGPGRDHRGARKHSLAPRVVAVGFARAPADRRTRADLRLCAGEVAMLD